MRDCLQSHRDRRLEALISPIAPTTATCEQQIKAKVVAGLRPVLADPNLLNSTGEHLCRSVVAAQVAADPLTSPDRLACQGQAGSSQDVTAANGDECRSKLDEALKTLLKDDTKNILGLQYELTTLKLARLAKKDSVKTLEGLVKKKQDQHNLQLLT